MNFVINGLNDETRVSYSMINDENIEIGTAEGLTNQYGELHCVIKVYNPDQHRKGIGFTAFNKIYNSLNKNKNIEKIFGNWHAGGEFEYAENGLSTNLKCFQEALETGKTKEESAFETPTGKWAKKLGYTNCCIISFSQAEVSVKFTK